MQEDSLAVPKRDDEDIRQRRHPAAETEQGCVVKARDGGPVRTTSTRSRRVRYEVLGG